jgi:ABC-2 type transport system permease protein
VDLPTDAAHWFDLAQIFVLGLAACALLGIAISSVPKSGRSATSVVVLPFLVLQFISGVYIAIDTIPDWMLDIGALFPLKWMCQGLRGVFLPDSERILEQTGSWESGKVALVLGTWCVGGSVQCLLTFRWKNRRDG